MATTTAEILLKAKMDVAGVKQSINEIRGAFERVQLPKNLGNKFIGDMTKINQEIANFERILATGNTTPKGLGDLAKSGQDILSLFNKLQVTVSQASNLSDKELKKLFPTDIANNIKAAEDALSNFTKAERIVAFNNPIMQVCLYFNMIFVLTVGSNLVITSKEKKYEDYSLYRQLLPLKGLTSGSRAASASCSRKQPWR